MNGLRIVFLVWSILAATAPAMLPGQDSGLDKTWTSAGSENKSGSQGLMTLALASRVSFQAEGMGFEPTLESAATDDCDGGCEKCLSVHAAMALHCESSNCLSLASIDADLQEVIAAWDGLPEAIRKAVMALIGSQEG
jgi:hypothetical protein